MTLDRDHMDTYVHNAYKWKIGLYEGGVDCCTPYNGYKYGVENQSTMARRKRPNEPHPHMSSTANPLRRPLRMLVRVGYEKESFGLKSN